MTGRPKQDEAAQFYWRYINRVAGDNPVTSLERQLNAAVTFFEGISEEQSLGRYAPEKWSLRQVLNHVTDMERVFAYRALWFGRGFTSALEGFDENPGEVAAESDLVAWADHVEAFRTARLATISLLKNLPGAAWTRSGVACGGLISVRALAFLAAGHVEHHVALMRERYLV